MRISSILIIVGIIAVNSHGISLSLKLTEYNSDTKSQNMKITIGASAFSASLANNATATAFLAKLPVSITMEELNGNEKFHFFKESFPQNATVPSTINEGDLMLYGDNCLVIFYKTFKTSYSYTRIGHIDNVTGLKEALGKGSVVVNFSKR